MTLAAAFLAASTAFSLPPGLLSSVCWVESRHVPEAIHFNDGGSNSRGICQIKRGVAKALGFTGAPKDLQDPKTNAYYAAKLLRYHLNRCKDTVDAIKAYNSGRCSAGDMDYVRKVLRAWAEKR